MPWPARQRKAIAAKLSREGKSREEISAFFRRHGHGGKRGDAGALMRAHRGGRRKGGA